MPHKDTTITVVWEFDGYRIKKGRGQKMWLYVGRRATRWICGKGQATCFNRENCTTNEKDQRSWRVIIQHPTQKTLYLTKERTLVPEAIEAEIFYDNATTKNGLLEFAQTHQ